jgi:N-acetylneuraminate synthase
MNIVAVIPAKECSTRLEDKNLQKIGTKSLIEIAMDYARTSKKVTDVIVSTDSQKIKDLVEGLGARCILRGKDLSGEAPLFDVYRHALNCLSKDHDITHILGLQPDNPDRAIDLDRAIEYVLDKQLDDFFTVDKNGQKNGSLRILSAKALKSTSLNTASILDECTNIHSMRDLNIARYNFEKKNYIEVSEKRIGNNEKVFVIAEAACNHMCDMDIAKQMIDEAAEAGADAIKFQTYKAERLVTAESVAYWGTEKSTQLKYYKNLDKFEKKEYRELFDYAKERGIIGFSSPFDTESASMLNDLGMPLFKIASCEINNLDFLAHIARFNKPIILSTGASTAEEIDTAIDVIFDQGNFDLVLLACTLSYPTENNNANLNRIKTLRERYPNITIGLSDHTKPDENMIIPAIAVAMGAQVIEKHYTLDRKWTGSGHFFSIQPEDLKKMISNIDLALIVRGTEKLEVMPEEEKALIGARKSIVADHDIKSGTTLTKDMLTLKRPGIGISSEKIDSIVGRVTKFEIASDSIIYDHMLCEESKDENTAYSCS